jgi:hypothetical protein
MARGASVRPFTTTADQGILGSVRGGQQSARKLLLLLGH